MVEKTAQIPLDEERIFNLIYRIGYSCQIHNPISCILLFTIEIIAEAVFLGGNIRT